MNSGEWYTAQGQGSKKHSTALFCGWTVSMSTLIWRLPIGDFTLANGQEVDAAGAHASISTARLEGPPPAAMATATAAAAATATATSRAPARGRGRRPAQGMAREMPPATGTARMMAMSVTPAMATGTAIAAVQAKGMALAMVMVMAVALVMETAPVTATPAGKARGVGRQSETASCQAQGRALAQGSVSYL
jgi:hypothetical protein